MIAGNWIQALGGITSIGGELEDSSDIDESYNIVGNVLQATGNSLQAIGGIDELKASRDKVEEISEGNEGGWTDYSDYGELDSSGWFSSFINRSNKRKRQEILDNNS